jgi:hypothetical protein
MYRLCTLSDMTPQDGQQAVGEVVRTVSVIASATETSSMTILGISGIIIIGCEMVPRKEKIWKNCSISSIPHP